MEKRQWYQHSFMVKIRQVFINTRISCIRGFRQKLLKECNQAVLTGVMPILKHQLLKLHLIPALTV